MDRNVNVKEYAQSMREKAYRQNTGMLKVDGNTWFRVADDMERFAEKSAAECKDKALHLLEDLRAVREKELDLCADQMMQDYLLCKMSALAEAIEAVRGLECPLAEIEVSGSRHGNELVPDDGGELFREEELT